LRRHFNSDRHILQAAFGGAVRCYREKEDDADSLVVFAVMPFTYLLVKDYQLLILIRFVHALQLPYTGLYHGCCRRHSRSAERELLSWFFSVTIIAISSSASRRLYPAQNADTVGPTLGAFQTAYILSGFAASCRLF